MLPPVHLGVAYLLYAGLTRTFARFELRDAAVLALFAGAILPDLIDQTLYRLVDLPSTRTLGHSLLFLVPLCVVVWIAVSRSQHPATVWQAFAIGALSHPAADALYPLAAGQYAELGFLLWPVTHSPPYEGIKTIATVGGLEVTTVWIEVPLLAVALVLWWYDGMPGLSVIRS